MKESTQSKSCFLASQMISTVGDGCFHYGIVLLAYKFFEQSGVFVGISQLMRTLPYFLAIFIAFYVVDHFRRGSIMRWADLLRFFAIFAIAMLFDLNLLQSASLFALLCVKSICDVHFLSARDSWITQIQNSAHRIKLNTLVQGASNIGFASGLGCGAFVMHSDIDLFGLKAISLVLVCDALSYLISFTLLHFTSNPKVPVKRDGDRNWHKLKAVLSDIPHLKTILWITALDNLFIMGPAFVAAPMLLIHQMYRNDVIGQLYFGYYEIWFAFSMFLGTVILYKKPPKRLLRAVAIGLTLDGATHLPFIFCESAADFKLLLLFAAIHAFCIPLLMVPRVTWIQLNVPSDFQGRVFALMAAMVLGVTGLSCVVTGWLIDDKVGYLLPSESFCYLGVGATLVGLWSYMLFRNADSLEPSPKN